MKVSLYGLTKDQQVSVLEHLQVEVKGKDRRALFRQVNRHLDSGEMEELDDDDIMTQLKILMGCYNQNKRRNLPTSS